MPDDLKRPDAPSDPLDRIDVTRNFEDFWSSTNNENWFRRTGITIADLKQVASEAYWMGANRYANNDAQVEARARLEEAKEWNKIVRGLGMADDEPHQAFQAADERIAALESAAREPGGQT